VQLVTIDDIRAAAELIRPYVVRTPLVPAGWADDERPLWIKPESLQQVGAFKVRGAFNAIANLDESVRTRGVVAYSSGNHAQAVAYAAAIYGVPASIVMPEETPTIKVAATRGHGAEVVLCGAGEREKVAAQLVEQTGGVLVPPFDHRDVIAGQGTVGLEIAEDLPAVDTVLVPVSGGGLASGIGTAIKALCPDARVFGVEPELAADTAEGLRLGHPDDCRRPAVTTVRIDVCTSATGARRCDHGVGERDSRCRARARLSGSSGGRTEWCGRAGRLSTRHNSAGSHGDDSVGRQHRSADAASDPGRLTQAATTGITKGTEMSHFSCIECIHASCSAAAFR
jgi:cysteine synthase